MSLLEPADLQDAGIGAELDEDVLQAAIDEEEAWLARRIGPLTGERTEHFALTYTTPLPVELRLRRPTATVEVEQDGEALGTVEVRGDGYVVANLPLGTRFTGLLDVTYEPNDELEIKRALRQLIGLTLAAAAAPGLSAEVMGSYSYARGSGSITRARRQLLHELRGPSHPASLRLLSSVRHGLAGAIGR